MLQHAGILFTVQDVAGRSVYIYGMEGPAASKYCEEGSGLSRKEVDQGLTTGHDPSWAKPVSALLRRKDVMLAAE